MDRWTRAHRRDKETQTRGRCAVHFPALHAPIARSDGHSVHCVGRHAADFAAVECRALEPRDIVPGSARDSAPIPAGEISRRVSCARGGGDYVPAIDCMVRRQPGSTRRRAVVGIAAAASCRREKIRGCPRGRRQQGKQDSYCYFTHFKTPSTQNCGEDLEQFPRWCIRSYHRRAASWDIPFAKLPASTFH